MGKVWSWTRRRGDHDHRHHDAHHDLRHVTQQDQDAHHVTNTDFLVRNCRKQEDKRNVKNRVYLAAASIPEDNCKTQTQEYFATNSATAPSTSLG